MPVGLAGPEALFPVNGSTLEPARVTMTVGRPLRADALMTAADGDRRIVVDALGLAIARLLPPGYRGVYAESEALPAAGQALARLEGPGPRR